MVYESEESCDRSQSSPKKLTASCLAEEKARDKENILLEGPRQTLDRQLCSINIPISDTGQEARPTGQGSQLKTDPEKWELSQVRKKMAEKLQSSLLFMTFIQHELAVTTDMNNQPTKETGNDAMVKTVLAWST